MRFNDNIMRVGFRVILLFWGGMIFFSCSVNKYIPANESLYQGASIEMQADSSIDLKEKQKILSELPLIIRPLPNSTIAKFPYRVLFYYVLGNGKSSKSSREWFRKKFGEKPVFSSKRAVETNTEIINNYLNNEGYFRSYAKGSLVHLDKKSKAHYQILLKPRYYIDTVRFVNQYQTKFESALLALQENSILKQAHPYRFEDIKLERQRIDDLLKSIGYYFFRPDFLIIKADTTLGNYKVNLSVELKPNILQTSLKKYYINEVNVFIDTKDSINTQLSKSGIRVFSAKNNYHQRLFEKSIALKPGDLYNNEAQDIGLKRLINLRNFKFVKNRFELLGRSDSALINLNYELVSLKKKSVQGEFNTLTRSNNLAGTSLGINWLNRNLFKNAEILKIGLNSGFDFQLGSNLKTGLNNYFRVAGEAELSIPRILLPFYQINIGKTQILPQTNIHLGYERLVQKGVGIRGDSSTYAYTQYTINSFRAGLNYSWRKNISSEHNLSPISITWIQPKNISEEFVNKIFQSSNVQDLVRYLKILETRFILGGQYNFVYTPTPNVNTKHYFYLNVGVDIAGNLAGLMIKKNDSGLREFGGTVFEQYARLDAELKYYRNINQNLRWANRLIIGYGIPYGNSSSLPYQVKQYFVGGSNSIRAFRARSIGPGAMNISEDPNAVFLNAYGDIKLELNTEMRIKVNDLINFATFVDAGNIWTARYSENSFYTANSTFGKDFYKQLAIGGGLGLRLDFTYFKLRFDLATPFRKPWLEEHNRWVIGEINPFQKDWRKQNLILNIAMDLPF